MAQGWREVPLDALKDAIANGGLALVVQEKVRLSDGAPAGFEALVRWPSSAAINGGVPFAPDAFVRAAEMGGLAGELGAWVVGEACTILAGWLATEDGRTLARFVGDGLLSVNASAWELEDPSWGHRFLAAASAAGVPYNLLEVEVTETGRDDGDDVPAAAVANLELVSSAGVGVALDDFGIRHSSVPRLRHLPVSVVKVDRSFVSRLDGVGPAAERDTEILRWIIGLRGLCDGVRVVVEGIETERQASLIRAMGADVGQGYLWSRPGDPDAALASAARRLRAADLTAETTRDSVFA